MNYKIIFLLFVSAVFLNAHGNKHFGKRFFGKIESEIKQIFKSLEHSVNKIHLLRDDSKEKNSRFLIGGNFYFNLV